MQAKLALIAKTNSTLSGCAAKIQKNTRSIATVFGGARKTRELLRIDMLGEIPKKAANFLYAQHAVLLRLVLRRLAMASKFDINVPSASASHGNMVS